MKKYSAKFIFTLLLCALVSACASKESNAPVYRENGEIKAVSVVEEENEVGGVSLVEKTRSDIEESLSRKEISENFKTIVSKPRKTGTEGNISVGNYIREKMMSYGYEVSFQPFPIYRETAEEAVIKRLKTPEKPNGTKIAEGRNIIAQRPDKTGKPKMIFYTHYDTYGDSVGALDDGAAVAVVMEVARIFRDTELSFEPVFVFFDAEKSGMYGSRVFLSRMSEKERGLIRASMNLDLVGNKNNRQMCLVVDQKLNKKTYRYDMVKDNFFLSQARKIFPNLSIQPSVGTMGDSVSFKSYGILDTCYTTVDIFAKSFDQGRKLIKEEDDSFVDQGMLVEDAKFISVFANELSFE